MIQIENLVKSYGRRVLFENVSFTVNPGERVGLVGRNGHGKTTLFRLILGEEHPDAGSIRVPSGYLIGHLSQQIRFSMNAVLAEACLGLPENEDGSDESYRVKTILHGLGFSDEMLPSHPRDLSGGYQIRLTLAKLLVSEPNLLLLDEPTNYLDVVSIRWLVRFLRNWKNELMIITHDRGFMDSVTTHTLGIHRQRVRKVAGPTAKLYEQLAIEEEHHEKTRLNNERKRKEVEVFIRRFRAKATKARAVQSRIKALNRMEVRERLAEIETLDFGFRSVEFFGKWLVDARDVRFFFRQDGPVLIDNFTMTIGPRDRIAVIGKNGKGKTTLLNLLAGETMPKAGSIHRHQNLSFASFGQTNIERLNPDATVEEEIISSMPEHDRKRARSICGLMMFEGDDALKKVRVLSGGEKSRVLLGKLLIQPVHLLLLDEPTNHLDMESTESLLDALSAFDGAVVIVTHNETILSAFPERLVVFDDARIRIFEGSYEEFLESVGWADEADQKPRAAEHRKPASTQSKKEIKRLRAELINSRSRIVGGLDQKISGAEDEIMKLEQQIADNNAALVTASEKGDWQSTATLAQENKTAQARIEQLFAELAALTEERDLRTQEFEDKLNRLS